MKNLLLVILLFNNALLYCQPVTGNYNQFIRNQGQIKDQHDQVNNKIEFLNRGLNGINTHIRKDGFSYDIIHYSKQNGENKYVFERVDIDFINASKSLEIIPIDANNTALNYYGGNGKDRFVVGVESFKKVLYRNIYQGIDLLFYNDTVNGNLKYNFILHPGADLEAIRFNYKGCKDLSIDEEGLNIETNSKKLVESIPLSWYQDDEQEIKVNYHLVGRTDSSFIIGLQCDQSVDPLKTVIVDPIPELLWSRYIGDSLTTSTNSVITDRFGYIYICGATSSLNNIATSGAYQTVIADSTSDAYLSKYNTYGSLIWSTYFGGDSIDIANSVYVDTSFNVYLTGLTYSLSGIADSMAYQDSIGGMGDAFLIKFNKYGQLKWATYYGGDSLDVGMRLSTDYLQNVYLGGYTKSLSGIADSSGFQAAPAGSFDGFVCKFDSAGNFIWSTYLGGQGDDHLTGIAFGDTSLYVCGNTNSSDFPINGVFALDSLRGISDGFITKFDKDGNEIWSSYYGGEGKDSVNSIRVFNNNIYFTGTTNSDSLISTTGAFQPLRAGLTDAFITKIYNDGSLAWATYLGGDSIDSGVDLFFELDSNLFIFGSTNSVDLEVDTVNAYQPQLNDLDDNMLAKFNNNGIHIWSTYYGGPEQETPKAIGVYGNTGIFVVGATLSDTAIVPQGQMWPGNEYNSDQEGFFSKFIQGKSTCPGGICTGGGGGNGVIGSVTEPVPTIMYCPGTTQMLTVQGGDLGTDADWVWYEGTCGNGPTFATGDTIYVSPTVTTTYYVRAESITNATECVSVTVYVATVTSINITSDSIACLDQSYTLASTGMGTFNWTGPNGFACTSQDTTFTVSDTSYIGWYFLDYADTNGCQQQDSIYINVHPSPEITDSILQITCFGYDDGSITLITADSPNVSWNIIVNDPFNLMDLSPGTYFYSATNVFGCQVSDTFNITEPLSFLVDTLIQETDCLDSSGLIILYLDSLSGPYSINWPQTGGTGDSLTGLTNGVYNVMIEAGNSCIETYDFTIDYASQFYASITDSGNENCDGNLDGYAIASGFNGTPPYDYDWYPGGQTTSSIFDLDTGTYIVTVSDSAGCIDYDTVTIGINSTLETNANIMTSFCSVYSGTISLYINDPGSVNVVNWSNGQENALTLTGLPTGNYSVAITDTFGCIYSYTYFVPLVNDLNVTIDPGDTTIELGESIELTAVTNYSGFFEYYWSPSVALSCNGCVSTTADPESEQMYEVIVDDLNGCIDTAYVLIHITHPCVELYIPSVFSPNNDQLNDHWDIIGTCIYSLHVSVFDQWGELIFESFDQSLSWDGLYKGKKVPNDQYTYVINVEYDDGTSESRSGSVRVMY